MKQACRALGLPALALCLLLYPLRLRAEGGDAPEPHRTVVIGPRHEADQVIDSARLTRHAISDLAQALESQPGLRVTRLGGLGAFATLSIRGSTAEQVGILLDGIPLNGADGGPVDLGTIPLGPLASVAIHRSFVPARYGVPALGGALVLKTRPIDALEARGELGAGSFSTRLFRAYAGAGGWSVHVDYLGSAGDFGFQDDGGTLWTEADDAARTRQNNASDQLSALVRGSTRLLDGLRLGLVHLSTLSRRGLPGLGVHPTTASRFDLTRHTTGLNLDLEADSLESRLSLWGVLSETEVRDPLGEIGPPRPLNRLDSRSLGATWTLRYAPQARNDTTWSAEAHAAWRHEHVQGDQLDSNQRHLVTVGGSGSVRHAALTLSLDSQLLLASAGAESPLGDSHQLKAGWSVDPNHRLSAALTRTFRLPSLYERFGDTGLVLGNPDLRPERSHGLELTWQSRLATTDAPGATHHALTLQVQAFARWHDDLIQFLQNAQNVARPDNIASARILGLELELTWQVDTWLETRLLLTLLEARDTSTIAARRGKRLALRPFLTAGSHTTLYLDPRLGLSLDIDAMGSNYLDVANLVSTRPRVLIGASIFAIVDAVRVTLSVHNLLDSRIQDLAGFPLPGLSAFATLRWDLH